MLSSQRHIWSVLTNHGFHSLEPPQECAQKANKREITHAGKSYPHRVEEFDVLSAQKIENNLISWDETLVCITTPGDSAQPVGHIVPTN